MKVKQNNEEWSQEVAQYVNQYGAPQWLDVLFCDVNGLFRHKRIQFPAQKSLPEILIPISATMMNAAGLTNTRLMHSVMTGDPDRLFKPIKGTLFPSCWQLAGTGKDGSYALDDGHDIAQVQISHAAEVHDLSYDPRHILAQTIDQLHTLNMYPKVALELEFMVFDAAEGDESSTQPIQCPPSAGGHYMSDMAFRCHDSFLTRVTEVARKQGLECPAIVKEYAEQQFEINLSPASPQEACDQAMRLKRIVHAVARSYGWRASFMAKPKADQAGNGMHAHCSFYHGSNRLKNICTTDAGRKSFDHILGGVLKTLPESIALLAPFANSYRRYVANAFAPTQCTWGDNHRSVAIRIPQSNVQNSRMEHRVAGADACPYLVVASMLAGAVYGLHNSCEPGLKVEEGAAENTGEHFESRWGTAITALKQSACLATIINKEFLDAYVVLKEDEEQAWHERVKSEDVHDLFAQV